MKSPMISRLDTRASQRCVFVCFLLSQNEFESDKIQTFPSQGDRLLPTHLRQGRRHSQRGRHGNMHSQHFLPLRRHIHQQTHPATIHVDGKGDSFVTVTSHCFAKCFGSFEANRTH